MELGRRRFLGTAAGVAAAGAAAACGTGPRPEAPHPTAASDPAAITPGLPPPGLRLSGEIVHGPRRRRQVALTFHGAGDPAMARRLLSTVASAGAQITVLAVGTWLDTQPEMARLILHGGHELGNHTQNHADISAMSPQAAHSEIAQCAERLRKLTGSIGAWFRPSQTPHANTTIRAQAAKVGYQTCLSYDVDSLDFQDPGPDAVVHNVLHGVRPGSIISMHLGHPGTVTAMPALLDGLRTRGLRAVTVSTLVGP